ncbi:MAG: hypothetical protein ACOXZS_05200 [Bacilli bacterium]|jgi:hypothetical protein
MLEMTNNELLEIIGGLNITGSLISSLTKGLNLILEISRSLGTALRRIYENKLCPL